MLSESREQLIAEIDRRLADKIIEPKNAVLLKRLIKNAETLSEAIDIAELGTTWKRTGFHFDKRLEKKGNTIKYLKKNKQLSFSDGKGGVIHKLIIGDNYDALLNLLIEYRGKIDVIYIDPPYGKDSMGQFADTNYQNAITRDNLLSMLYPRLILAKQLLSESGVIFCSIDDRNQAYVKCLMDDVFEESNFILNIVINRPSEIATSTTISKHEYMLMYARQNVNYSSIEKEINKEVVSRGTLGNEDQTQPVIEFPRGLKCYNIPDGEYTETRKKEGSKENVENLDKIVVKNGELAYPVRLKARWRASNDMRNFFNNNCNPTKAKISGTITEIYFDNDRFIPQIKKSSYLKMPSLYLNNKKGSNELSELSLSFDYPKSSSLIVDIVKSCGFTKNIKVLDFFAGSGTTGQAVLELNKQDGGNRQFILCTLNEITDTNPNGIAYDVTSKRLKRVMTGSCYDGTADFEWVNKNEPYGGTLDVYEICEVANSENTTGKTAFDVIDETLYGKEKFKTLKEKIEWVCNNFDSTQKYLEKPENTAEVE